MINIGCSEEELLKFRYKSDEQINIYPMKRPLAMLIPCCFILLLCSCGPKNAIIQQDRLMADQLRLEWEVVSNRVDETPRCRTLLQIRNSGSRELNETGWAFFYSQDAGDVIPESVMGEVSIDNLGGDFMKLEPGTGFRLLPGEEIAIQADHSGWIIKEGQAPDGIYIVFYNEDGEERSRHPITHFTIRPFTRTEQRNRFINDQTPDPTPEWQYGNNAFLSFVDGPEVPLVIPTPAQFSRTGAFLILGPNLEICYQKGLESDAILLAKHLERFFDGPVALTEGTRSGADIISLLLSDHIGSPEAYLLQVKGGSGIQIRARDAAGVFYGIQSLLALVPPKAWSDKTAQISIPECTIQDTPRFPYRGMHLDVSRNFNRKETVLKMIDVMSFYKLNRLHLHLTDDEGWRLQIGELPELTEVGAFRGHTLEEHHYLHPSYGSGPEPDSATGYGSGYYTREEYIEILKYADERHVQVIPEFDLPGHARAAIKAMEARYRRFMADGSIEKAEEYLLSDPEDRSVYRSAQNYNDNVVCVCRESVYRFLEVVADEVVDMYETAGVPLETIHIGGDEVPKGAWEKSPLCSAFLGGHEISGGISGLMDYFLKRSGRILKERNLILSGWEEIVLERDEHGDHLVKLPLDGNNFQVYIWDNFTAGNQDIGNKIANAGYPVVLCSVTNFYFELAYNKDPLEPGHYWGGFTDTRTAYEYVPFDVFKSLHHTPMGRPYDPETDFQDMARLHPDARYRILGIQGELWSEPIKGPDMLEYFYLPKMLGLAERAWSRQPRWAKLEEKERYDSALHEDWNLFANAIGQREMPRLDYLFGGYNYRLPPPGLQIVDGILYANSQFPGLSIRYTTDGSIPNLDSEVYSSPIRVDGIVTACIFNSLGRASNISVIREE